MCLINTAIMKFVPKHESNWIILLVAQSILPDHYQFNGTLCTGSSQQTIVWTRVVGGHL